MTDEPRAAAPKPAPQPHRRDPRRASSRTPRRSTLAYSDFLARLLRAQWHHRQESALAWRIKTRRAARAVDPRVLPLQAPARRRRNARSARFAELDFIAKAENIVFIGPTGVGKTGLASGLLLKALQNGYRGLFVRAQDLFDEMYASLADRSIAQAPQPPRPHRRPA